ncbi:hypothetical protein [Crateriforma spongiae]|uniref:hypothetical protein n=1 Tax=Crateriforma spongiae TaxID=2724528 RepID=UPI00197DC91C|nr:hypothetical protein [Crateriforma spongiae]
MRRRRFLSLTASVSAGGAIVGTLLPTTFADDLADEEADTDGRRYLEWGLNALARAHHLSSMAGHLGASLIAGYYVMGQHPNLGPQVEEGIRDDLRRVMRGESVFGKRMSRKAKLTDAELFEPLPKQSADETLIDGIAEALEKSIDQPRQSGHNVIFASFAIRALKEHPEYATPAIIDGIRKLMTLFEGQTPGSGYYGKQKGRIHGHKIQLAENDNAPMYDDIPAMASAVLDEAIGQDPSVHRVGYGGLVHIINHAAAIADLDDCGYDELASRAVRSHRQHLRLWRSLPNVADEKGPLQVSNFTPNNPAYWTSGDVPYDRALLTHRVKTMFGFHELAEPVDYPDKEKAAYDTLRYLM